MEVAVSVEGRPLDAFNTFLPKIYARAGFRAVARLPFSREFAPPGWDYDFFEQKFPQTAGEPDVMFMVYDSENASAATDTIIDDYDVGMRLQADALAEIDAGSGPRKLNQNPGDDGRRGSIQIPARGIDRGTTVINLFEGRDLSTLIHESGHYFYEVFSVLASEADAPQPMKDDLTKL